LLSTAIFVSPAAFAEGPEGHTQAQVAQAAPEGQSQAQVAQAAPEGQTQAQVAEAAPEGHTPAQIAQAAPRATRRRRSDRRTTFTSAAVFAALVALR